MDSTSDLRVQADQGKAATRFWIATGAFWFIFCITVWGLWITGPDFKPNTIGRDQASPGYVALVRTTEIVVVILALIQIWYFIVRPKIKNGKFSFDGLFFLACWMLYIQEPVINYNSYQFLYTTVDYNMGSWCRYIPGWNSPHPELIPVGSVIWSLTYLSLAAFWAFSGSHFMGWLKRRRPSLRPWQLVVLCFVTFIPADLVLEMGAGYLQLFNYASTVPALTLFAGKIYQFPMYEVLSWCATLTCLSSIHFFRNEQGESLPERKILQMGLPPAILTWCRFFAVLGMCETAFFICYNMPYFYWSTKGGSFPAYESYKIAGVCGPNTKFDCPSLKTPLAKADSPTNRIVPNAP